MLSKLLRWVDEKRWEHTARRVEHEVEQKVQQENAAITQAQLVASYFSDAVNAVDRLRQQIAIADTTKALKKLTKLNPDIPIPLNSGDISQDKFAGLLLFNEAQAYVTSYQQIIFEYNKPNHKQRSREAVDLIASKGKSAIEKALAYDPDNPKYKVLHIQVLRYSGGLLQIGVNKKLKHYIQEHPGNLELLKLK